MFTLRNWIRINTLQGLSACVHQKREMGRILVSPSEKQLSWSQSMSVFGKNELLNSSDRHILGLNHKIVIGSLIVIALNETQSVNCFDLIKLLLRNGGNTCFSLLNNLKDIIYGHVRKYVMLSTIFWTMYSEDLARNCKDKL